MQKANISQKAVDELVRKTIGKRAVEALHKSSTNPKWARYQMWGLSDGAVCHVNIDAMTAHVLEEGHSVKAWQKRRARKAKRAEAKLERQAKLEETKKAKTTGKRQASIERKTKRDAAEKAAQ